MNKKRIAILGSTGSIGTQTLNVIRRHPDLFEAEVLVGGSNAELLIKQALEFQPNMVVIADKSKYGTVCDALSSTDIKVFAGEESVCDIVEMDCVDIVMAAIVGFAGLKPTLNAIRAKKTIALANKETMVVAGEIVTAEARKNGVAILPVDSEHSAIFQTLQGEFHNKIDKILLTASGGPLFGRKREQIENVTLAEVLKHPNWSMGRKVTIDSASLMNKGLEVIEAKWLFGVGVDKIEVLVHPQSIVHSMVAFKDGSVKAQLGLPDMHLPIRYALGLPDRRLASDCRKMSIEDFATLTFERPDFDKFPLLNTAYAAARTGGTAPCVMNAANEIAVAAFLQDKIRFTDIYTIIDKTMEQAPHIGLPHYEDLVASNKAARDYASRIVEELIK